MCKYVQFERFSVYVCMTRACPSLLRLAISCKLINLTLTLTLTLTPGSSVTPDAAATQREAEKRAKYAPLMEALGVNPARFIPFVVEATGRFGPAASNFLKKLPHQDLMRPGVNMDSAVQFFKRKATAHVWLGNAYAMEACGHADAHVPRPFQ